MIDEDEKIKVLIKYCYSFQKTGRTSRCAKIIGRSLAECECSKNDIKVAKLLLKILEGDLGVK